MRMILSLLFMGGCYELEKPLCSLALVTCLCAYFLTYKINFLALVQVT